MEKKKNEPSLFCLLFGLALTAAGIILLLSHIVVSSFGFYHFGRISSGPVLVILFVFLLIWALVKGKKLPWIFVFADILCIIGAVILGTDFYLQRMSLFTLLLMLGMLAVGVAMIIRNLGIGGSKEN